MATSRAGEMLSENDRYRDAARPAGGSLGATMNQGAAVQNHPSANTLPELMHQGGSTKQGDQIRSKPLRRLMSQ